MLSCDYVYVGSAQSSSFAISVTHADDHTAGAAVDSNAGVAAPPPGAVTVFARGSFLVSTARKQVFAEVVEDWAKHPHDQGPAAAATAGDGAVDGGDNEDAKQASAETDGADEDEDEAVDYLTLAKVISMGSNS